MSVLIKGMDKIPEDGAVLIVKHDNGKAYIKHACTYGYSMELVKIKEPHGDLIDRAEAQTELQFAARRYTVAKEAHGEGQIVWSDNLISVTDAMNALRKVPSVQAEQKITHCENCKHKHLEKDVWTCPFGLPGGPRFFCGYGSDIND